MRIQLYDRGTAKGKKLFENLDQACQNLQLDFAPEFKTDMSRVYSMGATGETVLLINNEVALIDKYPSVKELESLIQDYLE